MITGLERFVSELRREGLSASPAEWIDAMRAVRSVGVADRVRFRAALRCTLAKRAGQRALFDRVFDRFFAPPASGGDGRDRRSAGSAGPPRGISKNGPMPGSAARRPDPERPRDAAGRERLQRLLREIRAGDPARRGRLRHVVLDPAPRVREEDTSRPRPGHRASAVVPWRRELRRAVTADAEWEIACAVPRLIEQIRMRSGRRLRRSRRGRLDSRRLFRENLGHGGVPWVLPFRRARPRTSKVVLLIDVSWSTARSAGLFLSIAGEFLRRARDTRVLLFIDRPIDATAQVDAWMRRSLVRGGGDGGRRPRPGSGIERGGVSFARLLQSLPELNQDAPSDYGRAFHRVLRSGRRPSGRTTALVVLGDGRTNRFDPQDWSFEEIASRCGSVLWLVPEAAELWGNGDSALGAYLPHVDVAVEARDLVGLSRGVGELLRRL